MEETKGGQAVNHIGDTNTMVSDTPRTDAAIGNSQDRSWMDGTLCRQLERELNAANERIKRLEEALEETVKCIVDLADSGDVGFWNPEEQHEIIAARAVLKKEDKL
jgi:hypothetical protein